MIAETGAKNGVACPTTSVAMTHARKAASVTWTIERAARDTRSARARAEDRDRCAASSRKRLSAVA